MRPRPGGAGHAARGGYTLIEMLVVMGIIVLLVTLVLLSISSMLRGAKMSNTVNLFIAAADEARTAGITLRRTVQVDLTRLDEDGKLNRLTTIGAYLLDPFETYPYDAVKPARIPEQNWKLFGGSGDLTVTRDQTQCLLLKAGQHCYNPLFRMERFEAGQEDYEILLQARFKFQPTVRTATVWRFKLIGCYREGSTDAYVVQVRLGIGAGQAGNLTERVGLQISSSSTANWADPKAYLDMATPDGKCLTLIKDGIWYRAKLSVKRFDKAVAGQSTPVSRIAAKVWVDGQLEPANWTIGPWDHEGTPFEPGFAGFGADGNDVLVDDAFFDMRSIRPLPSGMRVDLLFPEDGVGYKAGNVVKLDSASPFNFPIIFRPDGTAAKRYIVLLTDTVSGDRRYLAVEQNTGRTRPADSEREALLR
jgi:prepilin-type N-terminal cleavage/methylation domain-containing protein